MGSTTVVQLVLLTLLFHQVSMQAVEPGFAVFNNYFLGGKSQLNANPETTASPKATATTTTSTTTYTPITLAPFKVGDYVFTPVKVADLSYARDSFYRWYTGKNQEECAQLASHKDYGSFAIVGDRCYVYAYWRNQSSLVQPRPKGDGTDITLNIKQIDLTPHDCLLPDGSVIGPTRYTTLLRLPQTFIYLENLPEYEKTTDIECKGKFFHCFKGVLSSTDRTMMKHRKEKSCIGYSSDGGDACNSHFRAYPRDVTIWNRDRLAEVLEMSKNELFGQNLYVMGSYDFKKKIIVFYGLEQYDPSKDKRKRDKAFVMPLSDLPWADGEPGTSHAPYYATINSGKFTTQPSRNSTTKFPCLVPYPLGSRSMN